MPHDLSRSSANSASSSALSYAYGAPDSTGSASKDSIDHSHHHVHKISKHTDPVDMIDDDDDEEDEEQDSKQQKKVKRIKDPSPSHARQVKLTIVNADMIFYCFEILGNHLFNGRHRHGASSSSASSSYPLAPANLPVEPYPLFVSWFIGKDKQLRGCIGTFSPMDLAQGKSSPFASSV